MYAVPRARSIVLGMWNTIAGSVFSLGGHYDYREGVSVWYRSFLAFQPQPELMAEAPIGFQLHALVAFGLFALWPFTRLVHVFSAPVGYLTRPYIVYRSRDDQLGSHRPRRGWDRCGVVHADEAQSTRRGWARGHAKLVADLDEHGDRHLRSDRVPRSTTRRAAGARGRCAGRPGPRTSSRTRRPGATTWPRLPATGKATRSSRPTTRSLASWPSTCAGLDQDLLTGRAPQQTAPTTGPHASERLSARPGALHGRPDCVRALRRRVPAHPARAALRRRRRGRRPAPDRREGLRLTPPPAGGG